MFRELRHKTTLSLTIAILFALLLASFATAATNPHHQVTFATSGLPAGVGITITGTRTHPTEGRDYSITFTSPGPSGNVNTSTGTVFTYSGFPVKVETGGSIYLLSGSNPASPFTTGNAGSSTRVTASYIVCSQLSFLQQPVNLTRELDQAATLSVVVDGPLPNYQWRKGGANLPGENNPTLTIPAVDFDDEGDYDVVVTNGCNSQNSNAAHLTVTRKSQTIAFAPPVSPKAYRQSFGISAAASSGLDVTFNVNGGCSLSGATVTMTSGTEPCVITASQTGDGAYAPAQPVGYTVAAQKAPLTVSANDANRMYGEPNPIFTASLADFLSGETFGTSDVTGEALCSTLANPNSPVNTYPIQCTAGSLASDNYSFGFAPGVLTVSKATLTVTADNKSKVYGSANPTFTAGFSGFKNEEDLATSGVTGDPACSSPADEASPVGNFRIDCTQGTLDASNYSFYFAEGNLEVTPASLTATAKNKSKIYGAVLPAFDASITGFVLGEDETVLGGALACETAATATSPVAGSPYPINCSGLTSTNYSITYGSGELAVTKADQAIIFTAPPTPAAYHASFLVNPTADSGLPVTLTASGGCTNNGFQVTMTSSTLTCALKASQPGNGNYNPAEDITQTVEALKANQAITFTPPASPQAYGSQFAVNPTADSGLTVVIEATGACSYANGKVTMNNSAGTCTLKASQPGNEDFNPASGVTHTIEASKASQTILFPLPSSPAEVGASFTAGATASSGLPVSLNAGGACTVNGFTVTLANESGTCFLTASQAGDEFYFAAAEVLRSVEVVTNVKKIFLPSIYLR